MAYIPKQEEPASTEIASPTDANLALHVQRPHLQMLLWKAADKSDPTDVQLNEYGWEVKEHEHVDACHFSGASCSIETHGRHQVQLQSRDQRQ